MDFQFNVLKVLPVDQEGFVILNAGDLNPRAQKLAPNATLNKIGANKEYLAQIIDRMGEASSIAQGLKSIITTYSKFSSSGDNTIYIKVDKNKVCGFLKIGRKNLFYYDGIGNVKELKPLCVLDFYVHESVQRTGFGKALFEKMLEHQEVEPRKLAYDRPSSKFISFLKKHYGLTNYIPQNNNFVIFTSYWETQSSTLPTQKQIGVGIQSQEERKLLHKNTPPTDFNRVGRSILDNNSGALINKNSNMPEYSKRNQSVSDVNQNSRDYSASGSTLNDYHGKYSYPEKEKNPYEGLDRYKINEAPMTKYPEKIPESYSYSQRASPMVSNTQNYQNYYSRPPWASSGVGSNMDSYRTSKVYGNYYNQPTNAYPNNWRK